MCTHLPQRRPQRRSGHLPGEDRVDLLAGTGRVRLLAQLVPQQQRALPVVQRQRVDLLRAVDDAGGGGLKGTRDSIKSLTATMNDPQIKRGVDTIANGLIQIAAAAVRVVAELGNAIGALSEFFAANEKKGLASLQNRKTDLESQLFAARSDSNDSASGSFAAAAPPRPLEVSIAPLGGLFAPVSGRGSQ